jgi:hypothetical protein
MICTVTIGFAQILVAGIFGAICLMAGLVIGANSRGREERNEMDAGDPYLARTRVYQQNNTTEI